MDQSQIITSTRKRLQKFDNLRGKTCSAGSFWDIVVLTAVDEAQKHSYQLQLKRKLSLNHLPFSRYVVVADPPGPKIGNGGSTFVVIAHLHELYNDDLWSKKVIIIHAGGFSQRLPNASLLGKAFMAMPLGDPMYQALELKLATYIDFPGKMLDGGVFVCCADSIEVYHDADTPWEFPAEGFTALAHKSLVSIGRTHGVFVLDNAGDGTGIIRNCRKFLHKPSIETMETTKNCVVSDDADGKWVMTDSAFFISVSAVKLLFEFYQKNKPLSCEIDAYGDFLQALGRESSPEYVTNVENVCAETKSLVESRRQVYELLTGSPLYAVVLAELPSPEHVESPGNPVSSIFYHIGTFPEYLHHFTADIGFKSILALNPMISCKGMPQSFNMTEIAQNKNSSVQINKMGALSCSINHLDIATPCIMGSVLNANITVGEGSVVEYCRFGASVSIGANCVISNCSLPAGCTVPDNTFLHTAAVKMDHRVRYITVLFNIKDNLKKTTHAAEAPAALSYFGILLKDILDVKSNHFPATEAEVSLWTAELFPAFSTPEESGRKACEYSNVLSQHHRDGTDVKAISSALDCYSMRDVIRLKDVETMLVFRQMLSEEILDAANHSHQYKDHPKPA